jgi:hypothetical protein
MISIYSSAFNLITNNFNYIFAINNFCNIADEVVISVNTSQDNTLEELEKQQDKFSNLKIISSEISYDDPLLDGKIKNYALQNTSHNTPIKISLDMDEYIPLWQKPIWLNLATQLLQDTCLCYMIPSINLFKDKNHYFSITPKWYMHKLGLFRGPVNFARKNNGYIDTNKSDSCELIDANGNLVPSKTAPCDIESLEKHNLPFVVHTGYLSLENRLLRNENFWKKHWFLESGGIAPPHKIHEKLEDFDYNIKQHNLLI